MEAGGHHWLWCDVLFTFMRPTRIILRSASSLCFYYSALVRERSIAISFVSVCLSVREHISGTAGPIFRKLFVQIPCGRGSVLL